jgi:hypothetical protein
MSEYLNNAKESIGSATESIKQNLPDPAAISANITDSANSFRETAQNATSEFSSQGVMDASQEFLNSNSIIARFVFVILVLIVFMFLLNIGVNLVIYFTTPSKSPYIFHGMMNGNSYTLYPQDPASGKAVIYRSNNQASGAEFTWSIWLKVDVMPVDDKYHCVFVKGNDKYLNNGLADINNGPGLYLHKNKSSIQDGSNSSQLNLLYLMDVTSVDASGQYSAQNTNIPNLPIGKWFHVAIRLQNKTMDCYVNGVIVNRASFGNYIPKQNYDPIIYAGNLGFAGAASNLRYYDYALSVFEINSIVYYGPNLSSASGSANGYFDYLGQSWYSGNAPK